MNEPTTNPASKDIAQSPELKELEQAVVEAGQSENTEMSSEPEKSELQLLMEKKGFKSEEDLAKAYVNAESYSTRLSQELKAIKEEIRSIKTPQKEDPYAHLPDDQKQAVSILEQIVERTLSKKLQPLQEDLEVRRAGNQIEAIKKQYAWVSDNDINSALDLMENRPGLNLDDAIKLSTYDQVSRGAIQTQKKAEKVQQKERAFVESARVSKSGEVDYSGLTLEELEKILPSDGDFVDHKGTLRRG